MTAEYQMLVEQAKKNDTQAFTMLYEMIYRDMYRFALYILQNQQDAEDAVSEAVTDAYISIRSLRDAQAFRSWIFKILSAKCKRKQKEYAVRAMQLPEDAQRCEETMEEDIHVRQAFFRLDSEERLIVALKVFGGYDSVEIGKMIHKNPNTVRSRMSRALKKMEEYLKA